MATQIRAILCDLDGTLFDSVAAGKVRVKETVIRNGFGVPQDIDTRMDGIWDEHANMVKAGFWSKPGVEMMQGCFDLNRVNAERLYKEMEAFDEINPLPLVDGVCNVLDELKNTRKLPLGIVTNRHEENMRAMLAYHRIADYFVPQFIQARDMWSFRKPDPRAFCHILHLLKKNFDIDGNACAYIGDTPDDHLSAFGAGLVSVSVCTGGMTNGRFKAIGQKLSHVIPTIMELPQWLEWYQDTQQRTL